MKVVKVLWVDSCNSNMNWTFAEDIEIEPMYIESFGVVIKDINAQVMSSNANRIVGRIIAKPIIINNTFTTKGFFLNVPKA